MKKKSLVFFPVLQRDSKITVTSDKTDETVTETKSPSYVWLNLTSQIWLCMVFAFSFLPVSNSQ